MYRDSGRKDIELLLRKWRRPQVMQWLRFHHLEQYSKAFANVTGHVRSSCLFKGNQQVQTVEGLPARVVPDGYCRDALRRTC